MTDTSVDASDGHCLECGAELESRSVSGTDSRRRLQEASWRSCPECGGIEDVDGNWLSKQEQERQFRQQKMDLARDYIQKAQKYERMCRCLLSDRDDHPYRGRDYREVRARAFELRERAQSILRQVRREQDGGESP